MGFALQAARPPSARPGSPSAAGPARSLAKIRSGVLVVMAFSSALRSRSAARRPLQRGGAPHHALVELGVGLAHRALGLALRRGLAQHQHRAADAFGRVDDRRGVAGAPGAPCRRARAAPGSPAAVAEARGAQRDQKRRLDGRAVALVEELQAARSIGRPAASAARHPVRRCAAALRKRTRPSPSVAITPSPIAASVTCSHSRLSPACSSACARLRFEVLDGARHPQDQRAEGGDHQAGEERHAHRLAEVALALGDQARPADRERHDERRRQQPARHHRAGAPPGDASRAASAKAAPWRARPRRASRRARRARRSRAAARRCRSAARAGSSPAARRTPPRRSPPPPRR